MKNSKNNVFEVSGKLKAKKIELHQTQSAFKDQYIEYVIDERSIETFSDKKAKKSALVLFSIAGVFFISLMANFLGILSYVGIQDGVWVLILLPICLLFGYINRDNIFISTLPKNDKPYLFSGTWYQKNDNGQITKFTRKAKCSYPKCEGIVNIVKAPPREPPNHNFVGICSLGGKQHTYNVDFNGLGYPQKFDWRPLPENSYKNEKGHTF